MSVATRKSLPLAPFQKAFRQMEPGPPGGPNATAPRDAATRIAERLGWRTPEGVLDGPRVRRTLGLRPEPQHLRQTKNGVHRHPPQLRRTVRYETAVRLCEAMDIAPHEVGL